MGFRRGEGLIEGAGSVGRQVAETPGAMGVEGDEQIGRAVAPILAVIAFAPSRRGGVRRRISPVSFCAPHPAAAALSDFARDGMLPDDRYDELE